MIVLLKNQNLNISVAILLLSAVAAATFGMIFRWLGTTGRIIWSSAVGLALLIGVGFRVAEVPWQNDYFAEVSLLLREAGRQHDVKGVAMFKCHTVTCGNYFFLQKNVPMWPYEFRHQVPEWYLKPDVFYWDDETTLIPEDAWQKGEVNYLISKTEDVGLFAPYGPVEVKRIGDRSLYRLMGVK